MAKLAILDIGTNSIHLVLAEVEPDFSYKILDRIKDMTRLGDGVFPSRLLSESAMARGVDVVRTFVTLARNKGYDHIEAVATSAVREAKNGGRFIEAVAGATGLRVRVVTGSEEARLIYLGVRNSVDLPEGSTFIVDVGGGSVELIHCTRKAMGRGESLKLGAIRLKDVYLKHDPPKSGALRAMGTRIRSELGAALKRMRAAPAELLIATSGMAGNLAQVIHLRRAGEPLLQLNLATVTLKEIHTIEQRLAKLSLKNRAAIPGLDPKRADTLLPAAMVLRLLLELLGLKGLTLSDKAIREGMMYDFIERNRERIQVEREVPNVRRRQIITLARRCRYPEAHSRHAAHLALQLFDQTVSLHRLGEREREWLEYAALLHDIGYLISARRHHKHTYYLIMQSELPGFTAEEIEMIANVARYHRKAPPAPAHSQLAEFSRPARRTLEALSALLRIADGLDRSHFGVIQSLNVTVAKTVSIQLVATGDAELELWTARARANLFEKLFRRQVEFVL